MSKILSVILTLLAITSFAQQPQKVKGYTKSDKGEFLVRALLLGSLFSHKTLTESEKDIMNKRGSFFLLDRVKLYTGAKSLRLQYEEFLYLKQIN